MNKDVWRPRQATDTVGVGICQQVGDGGRRQSVGGAWPERNGLFQESMSLDLQD